MCALSSIRLQLAECPLYNPPPPRRFIYQVADERVPPSKRFRAMLATLPPILRSRAPKTPPIFPIPSLPAKYTFFDCGLSPCWFLWYTDPNPPNLFPRVFLIVGIVARSFLSYLALSTQASPPLYTPRDGVLVFF